MIALVEARHARVGIAPLCAALGLARATFYRRRGGPPPDPPVPRERRPPRQALVPAERDEVLALLHEARFVGSRHTGARHIWTFRVRLLYKAVTSLHVYRRSD